MHVKLERMKFGWKSIMVSIAGARLSHLVQENNIWDHGSMIEQVKTIFVYLKKAYTRGDPSVVRKCLTAKAVKRAEADIESKAWNSIMNADLVSTEIISVLPSKHGADKFTALMKFRNGGTGSQEDLPEGLDGSKVGRQFQQQWLFICEGNWWLLDEIKNR